MTSARVSLGEGGEDPKVRATKKVKSKQEDDKVPVSTIIVEQPASFREALLNVQGATEDVFSDEEWNTDDLPENRWYKDVEEPMAVDEKTYGGIPEIKVTDKELAEWSKEWDKTLVVNVLGKKVNYRMLENKAKRDWARTGGVKVIDMPRGFFAVHFDSDEDYNHALFEGPWMIADHYLLVQRWRPNFLSSAKRESKVAVWVRVPELPLELYNKKFLGRVGKALGTFLKMDHLTSIQSRGMFARFCVEIDLAKPLIPFVMFRGERVKLEFEGLHAVCFKCGIYGHRSESCYLYNSEIQTPVHSPVVPVEAGGEIVGTKELLVEVGQNSDVDKDGLSTGNKEKVDLGAASNSAVGENGTNPEVESKEDPFGPWMLVKRNKKKKGVVYATPNVRMEYDGKKSSRSHRPAGETASGPRLDKDYIIKGKAVGVSLVVDTPRSNSKASTGPSNGPLVIYEERTKDVDGRPPPAVAKIKRPNGGKNPQLGPRLRDTKKVARAQGALRKTTQMINGLGVGNTKENVHPNVTGLGKGEFPLITEAEISSIKRQQDKEKEVGQIGSNSQMEVTINRVPSPLDSPIDPNPLLGFIEHIDVAKSQVPNGCVPHDQFYAVVSQQGVMLSEQQSPNLSQ